MKRSAVSHSFRFLPVRSFFLGWRTWKTRLWVAAGLFPLVLQAGAGQSAEHITLTYGAIERSIAISSLEAYAETGEIPSDLRTYTRYLSKEQLDNLQQVLTARANLSPVAVAQFLYTEQGEILLHRLGELIRTESNLSGFYALRSAFILAAVEPEGLSLLTVLEEFPLTNLRLDLNRTLQTIGELEKLIRQTQNAVALVSEQSNVEARLGAWLNFNELENPQRPGLFQWEKQTLNLTDFRRQRSFPTDLYLPLTPEGEAVPNAPLIVISHGLGSDRSTYAYLATHLASYGFAVAVPEHPGSNAHQLQALISGSASQVTEPEEFINRPLDIQYLLDRLEVLNQTNPQYQGRMNLQQVGVIGQSMGGYTALALAGAQVNIEQLQTDCTADTFNLSLLLQCRALHLTQPIPDFRDLRVKAVVAISPIGSSLLGEADYARIQIPVMIVGGSADTIAPALPEQIRPFTWLQTTHRYLLLLHGGTHFSTIDVPAPEASTSSLAEGLTEPPSSNSPENSSGSSTPGSSTPGTIVQLPTEIVGPDPALAHTYLRGMSTAFFAAYVAGNLTYEPYLEPAYAEYISQSLMPLSLVQSLNPSELAKALDEKRGELIPTRASADARLRP